MRCPECNKFVPYDEPIVELDSGELDDEGLPSAEVHIILPCAECGLELKEGYLHLEVLGGDEHSHPLVCEEEYTAEWEEPEPIESKSGLQKCYGASVEVTVTCACGHEDTYVLEDSMPAADMDDMN